MKALHCYIVQLCLSCLLLICSALFFVSCRKFVAVPPPRDQVVSGTVFTDDATATAAVNGIYSTIMNGNLFLCNGAMSIYPGLCADEIVNNTPSAVYDPYYQNAISPDDVTSNYNRIWYRGYSYIYHCNAVLKGLDQSTGITTSTRQQLRGEILFLRSFCYWWLLHLYGDVPLLVSTSYEANAIAPRSAVTVVYEQLRKDLDEAISLLAPNYPTSGRVRVNKWAAVALQARLYLYQQDWAKAEALCSAVINSGMYSLAPSPNGAFTVNSTESILQFMPVPAGFNTGDGNAFVPVGTPAAKPGFNLTASLLAAFEAGDLRKSQWVGTKMVSSVSYQYPNKYKVNAGTTITEHLQVLRLAELYLIRAEAYARQGLLILSIADLNMIRQRAGLPALLTTLSSAACLQAIEQERRIELFAEWGHRWFDLRRTGRIDAVLSVLKPAWQTSAALFPLPQQELDRNPFLTQNPGY